jgi:pimeloyl-ACP methyl ester carboxylesterase
MTLAPITHRTVDVDGVEVFYREAGPADAPVVLLPHGYPSSSFQYRNLMPALGDRWRLVAPDFPGFGYSGRPDPDTFSYTFAGYARLLDGFVEALGIDRFALYLFDYGSQAGFKLASDRPDRIAALIVQNGDIYEDAFGPGYETLKRFWADPTSDARAAIEGATTLDNLRVETRGEVPDHVVDRISPDLWTLAHAVMTPQDREVMTALALDIRASADRYPAYHAYLREHRPPTLILWGPNDGYMPEVAGRAYLRDLPDAELHVMPDGGHWLLETHLDEVVTHMRDFLGRVHAPA